MEPFIQVEDDIKLAIEIASERTTLSGPEFAAKLQLLIETCRRQGHRAAQVVRVVAVPVREQPSPKAVEPSPPKPTLVSTPATGSLGPVRTYPDGSPAPGKSPIPTIKPMRTREDAMRAFQAKQVCPVCGGNDLNAPCAYPGKGAPGCLRDKRLEKDHEHAQVRKALDKEVDSGSMSVDISEEELERATRPDPPTAVDNGYKFKGPTGKARKVDDAGREDIRRRSRQARTDGQGRYPKGFIKRLAEEYDVSEALIYQIIYSDPGYEAVVKP
jgi:hypothetical protein